MQEEKHLAALKEVKTAINEALNDQKGILHRQRLLMAALSLGIQHMIEIWLHRSNAIKPGSVVKHEWFASEERKLRVKMLGVLTKSMETIPSSSKVLSLAREIERNRNDIIYGSPLKTDSELREKIEYFLELKEEIEKTTEVSLW